jgi:transcriptional regulator with XRE-family HTH domain
MFGNLRHAQTNVKPSFASHALDSFCVPCKLTDMRVRLEDIRDRRGLRLEDIAEKVGVAISTIQRWEKQSMSIPSERLDAIAAAYQCRIADIFDDGRPTRAAAPSGEELESMVEIALRHLSTDLPYPRALAASLQEQLLLHSGGRASGSGISLEPESPPAKAAQSRFPTKKSARAV